MILIDRFLSDEQDPKAVEKVLGKLNDMLSSNEELIYLAVQKRPAVNLLPDCIAVSTKRIFYCTPGNLGFTMNFKDISWKTIKEISFKEEIFGSKFICVPQHGENIITEYIPKVQARKLYQAAHEQLEAFKEEQRKNEVDERRSNVSPVTVNAQPAVPEVSTPEVEEQPAYTAPAPTINDTEDEITLKLRKLKTLFDKQLITLEEYEAKKADILDSF